MDLVDLALLHRQAGGLGRRRKAGLAILGRHPHLAALWSVKRRGVHRLHCGVILVGEGVGRRDRSASSGQDRPGIARLSADEGVWRIEPFFEHGGYGSAGNLPVGTFVPCHRQGIERRLRPPPSVGDHRDRRVVDLDRLAHARHADDRRGVEARHLATEIGAGADRRVEHAGQFQIGAINLRAVELVGGVEPGQRLASDRPVPRIFKLHVGRRRHPRGGGRHLAEGRGPIGRSMRDHAHLGDTFAGRHAPFGGGRRDQHLARRRATHAHIFMRFANAAAAAGRKIAPDAVAREVLGRRRIFGGDLGPVAVQLFGDELRQAGQRSLPHLGTGDTDHDRVIRLDHHPGIDLGRHLAFLGERRLDERHVEAEGQAAGRGGYADDEVAARD